MVSPQARREAVTLLMTERDFGVTRACGLLQMSRSLYRYRSRRVSCAGQGERIAEIAAAKRRYGYRRIHIRLKREGWKVNRKHVYRLYRLAGLAVRRRKRKRIDLVERKPLPRPALPNQSWSMDFVSDGLADGRRIRCLNIVDDCTRECLAIEVDTSLTGSRVKAVLKAGRHPRPAPIHHRGSRSGARRPGARQLGLRGWRAAVVHPARQAERERLHRELQRQVPR